ncbi:LysE/ArgO family amino acid transporter [Bacillus velezensis]|uniref:LysE/ArgO family amino acid transporter n=1 Tax=Bacillus TaxID=1386 RepID=UPI00045891F8|nr:MULTISPECIES: LysE/ArgO family amino acid transporter [Bacillus]AIW36935.1 amino acid transporter [Bacillus subtilis]AHZ15068.1 Arginine exporter protein argO [Bacillus velezensis SQR9]AKF77165.1 amino acid transporter [Bacillus velezensis]MDH2301289.1 LysE/ArgO family amino acid transporter [Bacillus velezensis]MDL5023498.1 LysE/ArgO family amino acid transporter [Bacillus velezensis]
MNAILHGVMLAFGLILPLGAQNVFIFQQGAWQKHVWQAFPAVIAAAVCDTILISAAVAGVSMIIAEIPVFQTGMLIGGFLFLSFLGWQTWRSKPQAEQVKKTVFSAKKQAVTAAMVSLLNPHAILDTVSVIGTSSAAYPGIDKWLFAGACIAVSWVWFAGLAFAGRLVQTADTGGRLLGILNKCSALVMWGAAFYFAALLFR